MESSSGDSQLRFDGRVAAITGGAQGMGREHAILLGKRGARIVVNDLDSEGAESTAEAVRAAGGEAVVVHGSIAQKEVAQAVVEVAVATWGRIDIVINNAGIEIKKPFLDFTDEDLSRMMAVHVWGSWMLTQLAWPHMRKQKYGRILMVSSATIAGMPGNAAYTAAKGALFGLGRTLAVEGQADGITVNMFGPFANTAMARQMLDDESLQWMGQKFPASATSAAVAWLVHEECKINGEFITSYGRGIGRIALIHSQGAEHQDGVFTPEAVRDLYSKAADLADAEIVRNVDDLMGVVAKAV